MDSLQAMGTRSILVRLGLAMGLVVALAVTSIFATTILNELSTGKAQAINVAGSLRMLTYRAAATALDTSVDATSRQRATRQAIADFETRLAADTLFGGRPRDASPGTGEAFDEIARRWQDEIRPLINRTAASARAGESYLASVGAFVDHIDRFVLLLETDAEHRIQQKRVLQAVSLVVIIITVLVTMIMMQLHVVHPLKDLLRCAQAIRTGDFSTRVTVEEQDELGQLGSAFNIMAEDLARMYANLEDQVAEKTREIAQANRSLDLLYRTSRALSENELSPQVLLAVLRDVEQVFDLRAGAVCVSEPGIDRAFTLATDLPGDGVREMCERAQCQECFGRRLDNATATDGDAATDANKPPTASADLRVITLALDDGERRYGVLPLALARDQVLAPWQMQLLRQIAGHIATALANVRRNDESRRLALLEERSAIARELHDSLAQSLSYLKIQVTRLEASLAGSTPSPQTKQVVGELRDGLAGAYRQLRELLTTFRLRIEGGGLASAIEETIADFTRRTGIPVHCSNALLAPELDANEGVHVVQVIREAISNVEHHAGARNVWIDFALSRDHRVTVRIDDDGRGIAEGPAPQHHYGRVIMQERARSLNGKLSVGDRPQGGTRVELEFCAGGRFAGGALPSSDRETVP